MTLKQVVASTFGPLLTLFLLLMPGAAMAQQSAGGGSLGAALLRTGAALLFILGLFFLFVYLMKRFFPGAFVPTMPMMKEGNPKQIKLLSTKQLGPKRYLHVVKVGSREFLIGAGEQGLSRLGEWESDSAYSTSHEGENDSSEKA